MQILFVQGAGAGAHDDWDAKLVASLAHHLGPGYMVRYPRMPDEANPRYAAWNAAIETELDADILVGHSVGGAMLIHTLAERAHRYRMVVLIAAPFIGEGGCPATKSSPARGSSFPTCTCSTAPPTRPCRSRMSISTSARFRRRP